MSSSWYCRSVANDSGTAEDEHSHEDDASNYKNLYRNLKHKLKFLIYENECFQEALRSTQRQLLKANRDKSFLLDRLLHYEKVEASLTESEDETDFSEDEVPKVDYVKRRKTEGNSVRELSVYNTAATKSVNLNRKKKCLSKPGKTTHSATLAANNGFPCTLISDGHMTPEEVEKHLESRQNYLELVPEKAPPTVPTEMFSNDTSLDKLE